MRDSEELFYRYSTSHQHIYSKLRKPVLLIRIGSTNHYRTGDLRSFWVEDVDRALVHSQLWESSVQEWADAQDALHLKEMQCASCVLIILWRNIGQQPNIRKEDSENQVRTHQTWRRTVSALGTSSWLVRVPLCSTTRFQATSWWKYFPLNHWHRYTNAMHTKRFHSATSCVEPEILKKCWQGIRLVGCKRSLLEAGDWSLSWFDLHSMNMSCCGPQPAGNPKRFGCRSRPLFIPLKPNTN